MTNDLNDILMIFECPFQNYSDIHKDMSCIVGNFFALCPGISEPHDITALGCHFGIEVATLMIVIDRSFGGWVLVFVEDKIQSGANDEDYRFSLQPQTRYSIKYTNDLSMLILGSKH
mmetsp:Transcript_12278/g.17633  ORF Transcript_12278/g.17633 Transcript_12278/m.17633 type:complete len:117 (+) Transcript_12278:97-447(+)